VNNLRSKHTLVSGSITITHEIWSCEDCGEKYFSIKKMVIRKAYVTSNTTNCLKLKQANQIVGLSVLFATLAKMGVLPSEYLEISLPVYSDSCQRHLRHPMT